jgi:hypothetical protein
VNKPTIVEIPPNATEQVVRIQLEEVQKIIKKARAARKDRIRVTIE